MALLPLDSAKFRLKRFVGRTWWLEVLDTVGIALYARRYSHPTYAESIWYLVDPIRLS